MPMYSKLFLLLGLLALSACGSSEVVMTMDSLRLINSTDGPQEAMNYANKNCRSDFYVGASFISKSGDEYRFRCVKTDDSEGLVPVPRAAVVNH